MCKQALTISELAGMFRTEKVGDICVSPNHF